MNVRGTGLDLQTATREEIEAAMKKGVRATLRNHKQAGMPAIVFDYETNEIITLPPDQIPDFPDDDEPFTNGTT